MEFPFEVRYEHGTYVHTYTIYMVYSMVIFNWWFGEHLLHRRYVKINLVD